MSDQIGPVTDDETTPLQVPTGSVGGEAGASVVERMPTVAETFRRVTR